MLRISLRNICLLRVRLRILLLFYIHWHGCSIVLQDFRFCINQKSRLRQSYHRIFLLNNFLHRYCLDMQLQYQNAVRRCKNNSMFCCKRFWLHNFHWVWKTNILCLNKYLCSLGLTAWLFLYWCYYCYYCYFRYFRHRCSYCCNHYCCW